jgi:hypothetical protein
VAPDPYRSRNGGGAYARAAEYLKRNAAHIPEADAPADLAFNYPSLTDDDVRQLVASAYPVKGAA